MELQEAYRLNELNYEKAMKKANKDDSSFQRNLAKAEYDGNMRKLDDGVNPTEVMAGKGMTDDEECIACSG